MLNQRHSAAQKVAAHLFPAERDINASMRRTAELTLAILDARAEARVNVTLGVDALRHNAQAGVSLAEAWGSMVLTHKALRQDQHEAGLDAVSYGDNDQCVEIFIPGAHLSSVATAA